MRTFFTPGLKRTHTLTLLGGIGLFLVLLAAFSPIITAFFVSDDLDEIDFVRMSGPLGIWIHTPTDYFRPLFSIILWAEWHLWHRSPIGYHVDRLLLHVGSALLLYLVGRQLKLARGTCVSASALFLVLPGHAEAVAWIADLGGLLVTFFGLLCIYTYLQARLSRKKWLFAASILFMTIALLSKEAAVTLPFVLIVIEYGHSPPPAKRWHPFPLGACLLLPGYFLARKAYVGSFFGGPMGAVKLHPLPALAGILRALPATLSPTASQPRVYVVVALLTCVVLALLFLSASAAARRSACLFLALFFVMGLPGFWTTYSPAVWGYDTRVLYPASGFACLFLAILFGERAWRGVAVSLLFLLFAFQSYQIFTRWNRAGEWVRLGLSDLAPISSADTHLIVLTNPDMCYPAYVFRRGLTSGLRLFYNVSPASVYAPEAVTYYSDADAVTVAPAPTGCIVTVHYAARPLRRTSIWNTETGTLPTGDPPSYLFTLPPPTADCRIVYFSQGRFHEWVRPIPR